MTLTAKEQEVLNGAGLFSGITGKEIETLLPCLSAKKRTYAKDETVLSAGEKVAFVGIVLSGELYAERLSLYGDRSIVQAFLPGDSFGLARAVLPDAPSDVDIMAGQDCAVLFLSPSGIFHTCGKACSFHAGLVDNAVRLLARKNLSLNEKLVHVSQKTTRDKVLSYLTAIATRTGKRSFDIPFDRQGLADYLNVDRSGLSFELSKMKKDGLIDCRKNHFTLLT